MSTLRLNNQGSRYATLRGSGTMREPHEPHANSLLPDKLASLRNGIQIHGCQPHAWSDAGDLDVSWLKDPGVGNIKEVLGSSTQFSVFMPFPQSLRYNDSSLTWTFTLGLHIFFLPDSTESIKSGHAMCILQMLELILLSRALPS